MKKNAKVFLLVTFFLLCVGIWFLPKSILPRSYYTAVGGTYLCRELPREMLTFLYDGNTFIYYYIDNDGDQKADEGTYSRLNDEEYIIQSDIFKDVRIASENQSFYTNIDGVNYLFKWSSVPVTLGMDE